MIRTAFWHIAARFYEARANRAYGRFIALRGRAEEFYCRLRGQSKAD